MRSTILLVDDNEDMLEFIIDDLSEDYRIVTAINGQQALAKLNEEVINLVISDVMMPVMDGFEFCRILKSNLEYSHIPVILLTAKNTLQSKIEGLELGADAYIEKPFAMEYLQVQVANLLANRNKIKQYFAQTPLAPFQTMASSKSDEDFLRKLNEMIYENLEETELDVDWLARHMNMSRPTFFRKIKAITDMTPNELVNISRLKRAAELLAPGNLKIFEVALMVGYNSQTNFGRNFLKQFGMTPTEYQKSKQRV
jgi:two-component system, cell cycle response regulator